MYPAVFILAAAVAAIPVPVQDGTATWTSKPPIYRTTSPILWAYTILVDGSLPNERRTIDITEGGVSRKLDRACQGHRSQILR